VCILEFVIDEWGSLPIKTQEKECSCKISSPLHDNCSPAFRYLNMSHDPHPTPDQAAMSSNETRYTHSTELNLSIPENLDAPRFRSSPARPSGPARPARPSRPSRPAGPHERQHINGSMNPVKSMEVRHSSRPRDPERPERPERPNRRPELVLAQPPMLAASPRAPSGWSMHGVYRRQLLFLICTLSHHY